MYAGDTLTDKGLKVTLVNANGSEVCLRRPDGTAYWKAMSKLERTPNGGFKGWNRLAAYNKYANRRIKELKAELRHFGVSC